MQDILKVMKFCFDNYKQEICTRNNLKKKFEKEYAKFRLFCEGGGEPFIHEVEETFGDKPKKVIALTQRGVREYFKLKEEYRRDLEQKNANRWTRFYVVVFSGLVIITIFTSAYTLQGIAIQTQIQYEQLNLMASSVIPNKPELVLMWDPEVEYAHRLGIESKDIAYIPIKLKNIGAIDSGAISIRADGGGLRMAHTEIDNLEYGDSKLVSLHLYPACWPECNADENLKGQRSLRLEISCFKCDEDVVKNIDFVV